MNRFLEMLKARHVIILDGGMGTELYARGYKTVMPLWSATANIDAPELVESIHADYVDAGADIITTNTFRTQPHAFAKIQKKEKAEGATKNAVRSALNVKKQAAHAVFVGGGLTTVEDCYQPDKVPDNAILMREHSYQADLLANFGVDFLFCETINTIREARILLAACAKTGLPFLISFVTDESGNLLSGETITEAVAAISGFYPAAILLNCRSAHVLDTGIGILNKEYLGIRGVYANGDGKPDDAMGWKFESQNAIEGFVAYAKKWAQEGVKIIGGCCGTNPTYIAALSKALK